MIENGVFFYKVGLELGELLGKAMASYFLFHDLPEGAQWQGDWGALLEGIRVPALIIFLFFERINVSFSEISGPYNYPPDKAAAHVSSLQERLVFF